MGVEVVAAAGGGGGGGTNLCRGGWARPGMFWDVWPTSLPATRTTRHLAYTPRPPSPGYVLARPHASTVQAQAVALRKALRGVWRNAVHLAPNKTSTTKQVRHRPTASRPASVIDPNFGQIGSASLVQSSASVVCPAGSAEQSCNAEARGQGTIMLCSPCGPFDTMRHVDGLASRA